MALFPGATISADRVVIAASNGQAITGVNQGTGFVTVNPAVNTYNAGAAQTETVPALATRVLVQLEGPGGNGGAGNSLSPGGGGGGGGAYTSATFPVTPGQTFTYTVGTVSGTPSTVVNGTAPFISLSAGSGTDGATSAAGGAAGTGGVATNSYSNATNANGTNGTAGVAGNGGAGGAGAAPLGGAGAVSPGTGDGTAGVAPGGGGSGSGSASAAAGGAGAAGRIIFTYSVDKVAIDTNAVAGNSFDNGFAIGPTGAMYGTTAVNASDDYQAGVRRSAAGAVVYIVGAPTQFGNGNPLGANGELACI